MTNPNASKPTRQFNLNAEKLDFLKDISDSVLADALHAAAINGDSESLYRAAAHISNWRISANTDDPSEARQGWGNGLLEKPFSVKAKAFHADGTHTLKQSRELILGLLAHPLLQASDDDFKPFSAHRKHLAQMTVLLCNQADCTFGIAHLLREMMDKSGPLVLQEAARQWSPHIKTSKQVMLALRSLPDRHSDKTSKNDEEWVKSLSVVLGEVFKNPAFCDDYVATTNLHRQMGRVMGELPIMPSGRQVGIALPEHAEARGAIQEAWLMQAVESAYMNDQYKRYEQDKQDKQDKQNEGKPSDSRRFVDPASPLGDLLPAKEALLAHGQLEQPIDRATMGVLRQYLLRSEDTLALWDLLRPIQERADRTGEPGLWPALLSPTSNKAMPENWVLAEVLPRIGRNKIDDNLALLNSIPYPNHTFRSFDWDEIGRPELVTKLIQSGADMEFQGEYGDRPSFIERLRPGSVGLPLDVAQAVSAVMARRGIPTASTAPTLSSPQDVVESTGNVQDATSSKKRSRDRRMSSP